MGRGRQKAKQTKVARALKYSSPQTDYDALQRELSGGRQSSGDAVDTDSEEFSDEYDDPYDDEYDSDVPRRAAH